MSTKLRAELSTRNPYYIPKERRYELKYHCLQYGLWIKRRRELIDSIGNLGHSRSPVRGSSIPDPVYKISAAITYYDELIKEVERCCHEAEPELEGYLLKGVTEGLSYDKLYAMYEIPCGKDMYYDRYKRFFYILDKSRRN